MYVRLNLGRREGELVDIRTDCALLMIADGRATDPRAPIITSEDAPNPEAALNLFVTGGIVESGEPVMVGERVSDHVIPRALAEKVQVAAQSQMRRRR